MDQKKSYELKDWIATRAEGFRLLTQFIPNMGQVYAQRRGFDNGPGKHVDVSCLSPYIRRRLVTEYEVISAAIDAHGLAHAERFVEQLLWRTYFRGWLELRPDVWVAYWSGLNADLVQVNTDSDLRDRFEAAVSGRSGLTCFDNWINELVQTGYLHNHARMWFASIWVFTLGLPWRLGADFFYRHLLDGDAASNICSWRWVAGLHTWGKAYEARASNISTFTRGRFSLDECCLASDIRSLHHLEPEGLPAAGCMRKVQPPKKGVPTAVLLTEEDCSISEDYFSELDIRAVGALHASNLRSPLPVSAAVAKFESDALDDHASRLSFDVIKMNTQTDESIVEWVQASGAKQLVMPYVPVGPLSGWLTKTSHDLQAQGVYIAEWRRDWDTLVWPYATAGFFRVKSRLPEILKKVGLI